MPVTDTRFTCTKRFCVHCLTSDVFFVYKDKKDWGHCPDHPDLYDVVLWQDMEKQQRDAAAKKFNKMWTDKHEHKYTNL